MRSECSLAAPADAKLYILERGECATLDTEPLALWKEVCCMPGRRDGDRLAFSEAPSTIEVHIYSPKL